MYIYMYRDNQNTEDIWRRYENNIDVHLMLLQSK